MGPLPPTQTVQETKRRSSQQPSRGAASSAIKQQQQQQQKLSFHASPSPSPSQSQELASEYSNLELSPTSKRRKLDNVPIDNLSISPPRVVAAAAAAATVETMYNFSTPGSSANNAISLGNSPENGRRRRISSVSKVDVPSGKTGAKKLVVKNFRTVPKSDPSQYCQNTTKQLDEALTSIFADQRPTLSNEELYRGCENVCKLGQAEQLAQKVIERIKHYVSGDLKTTVSSSGSNTDVQVSLAVVTAWQKWRRQLNTIRQIFAFLDRSHLLQTRISLETVGFNFFTSEVYQSFKQHVLKGSSDLLFADRTSNTESSDPDLFGSIVKMCYDLSIYSSGFEEHLLAESQTYIAQWADENSTKLEIAAYLDAVMKLMAEEQERCKRFNLSATTSSSLLTILEDQLVERRLSELTNQDSIADLLEENQKESLGTLFELLERRRLGTRIKTAFAKWIEDTGTAIVFDEKEQDQMITKLLDMKRNLDFIWRSSFHKNVELGIQLRESFTVFMNKTKKSSGTWNTDNSKPGEMIAKYVDHLLRLGAKAIPAALTAKQQPTADPDGGDDDAEALDEDSELNSQLDQVLDLFRFLQGKAVFEAFYKKDLARRLLLGRSADADAERGMLTRLKNECGESFTQNLEQMFKDIELGRDEMSSYKNRIEATGQRPPVDLNVNILSAAAWPGYPDIAVNIPVDVQKTLDAFEQTYQSKHTGRRLQWKHALAHCQLRASFPKGKKEMVVSSFQAIIMLMFNNVPPSGRLSYERIKAETGLPEVDAKRTLQSLACAKLRPLNKHPRSKEVADTDEFSINDDFHHERFRFKINQLQAKETREENKATHEQIAADRKYETQAAIVRILKTRKTVGHAVLIAETIKATQTRGVLQPNEIKKQIDALIEKEYMERGEGNTYTYLA